MRCSVYILYSEKIDKYYIGSSHDPQMRLYYHNLGQKGWTKRGIPWKLVYQKEYKDKMDAMRVERHIKKLKSRKIVEKIISGALSI